MKIETGDWIGIHGKVGHVCGTSSFHGALKSIDVCFRPHACSGYNFSDHREFFYPFTFITVLGKLSEEKRPFNPYVPEKVQENISL